MAEEESIVYKFNGGGDGRYLDGVPLRDLTAVDVERIPSWQVPALESSGLYSKVKPTKKTPEKGG